MVFSPLALIVCCCLSISRFLPLLLIGRGVWGRPTYCYVVALYTFVFIYRKRDECRRPPFRGLAQNTKIDYDSLLLSYPRQGKRIKRQWPSRSVTLRVEPFRVAQQSRKIQLYIPASFNRYYFGRRTKELYWVTLAQYINPRRMMKHGSLGRCAALLKLSNAAAHMPLRVIGHYNTTDSALYIALLK